MLSRKQKILKVNEILKTLFEDPVCELVYNHDFELLFAIVMSAQTTDKQVNKVTSDLFKKYKCLEDYANTNLEDLKKDISSIGLFNAKATNIQKTAYILINQYNKLIPKSISELQLLPGVGRKTANVYLWEMHGINEGMAIDTHIHRMAIRLGLSKSKNVLEAEKDLCKYLDPSEWGNFGHRLILYGRYYWPAIKKSHDGPLNEFAIISYKKNCNVVTVFTPLTHYLTLKGRVEPNITCRINNVNYTMKSVFDTQFKIYNNTSQPGYVAQKLITEVVTKKLNTQFTQVSGVYGANIRDINGNKIGYLAKGTLVYPDASDFFTKIFFISGTPYEMTSIIFQGKRAYVALFLLK